jgi:hypothetical protein
MRTHRSFLGVVLGLAMLALPASAHHGTNISYDHDKPVTMTGTVTEFVWQNPHVQLYFDAKEPNGTVRNWASELNSPSVLRRQGWTRTHFKPGDQITITLFPSKAGAPVGVVDRTKAILVDGKERVRPNQRNVD